MGHHDPHIFFRFTKYDVSSIFGALTKMPQFRSDDLHDLFSHSVQEVQERTTDLEHLINKGGDFAFHSEL